MTRHVMTITHELRGWRKPPLAFSASYWTGLCAKVATNAAMGDAALAAVGGFRSIILAQTKDVDTSDLETKCLDNLLELATAGYTKPDGVWAFPAIQAMLLAARHDIELHGYSDRSTLKVVLGFVRLMSPLEVAMEKAGKRFIQSFPAYDRSFEACVPVLFGVVAEQVAPTAEEDDSYRNPFGDFLKAAEDIRHHFRELAETDFQGAHRKWVLDSLVASARVHLYLLVHPPKGSEPYLEQVDEPLRWLISWVSEYFSKQCDRSANDAADSLACLEVNLLEHNRVESALECGKGIARVAAYSAALRNEPYALADIQERLEILARAASALGFPQQSTALRAMIEKPSQIEETRWALFEEARGRRWSQLDERLRQRRRPYAGLQDDPIDELQRVSRQ